jgi:DUF1365 family protein
MPTFSPRLFIGQVMHRRLRPIANAFVYPMFYVQLPLRDLESANCGVFSVNKPNLLSFRNADHGPRDGTLLLPWIGKLLRAQGLPDDGEIVLQTCPRVFGYVFNPVSFWFCYDRSRSLIAVLAEVNNTFGGTHSYLLHNDGRPLPERQEIRADKRFHVSPFCTVTGHYDFRFRLDKAVQVVRIDYDDGTGAGPLLLTAISGKPAAWGTATLLRALLRMPLLTFGVVARIHWQALRLWIKKVPFHGTRGEPSAPTLSQPRQEPIR